MLTINCLKEFPDIINKINYYLEPILIILIKDNFRLILRNRINYNLKFEYLIQNNIVIKYALEYAKFPENTLQYICKLSKIISIDDAFDMLTIIPFHNRKLNEILNIINDVEVFKLIHYNYSWTTALLKKNMNINLIKILLQNFYDFYFFEILFINKTTNNYNKSFKLMTKDINSTLTYKINFYKLRQYGVPHIMAYNLSRFNDYYINKIINIAMYGYYDCINLQLICFFDETQIDFLKFCKYGYVDNENFNKVKNNIVEKAFFRDFIDETNSYELFEPLITVQNLPYW